MNDFTFYISALLIIVIGFLIIRKVATCLIKIIILAVAIALIAFIYYGYMN